MRRQDNILLKNTVMLYALTFSTYIFNLITVPYQTRVLGPIIYGKLGFAQAFVSYIQLFLDFGFILSATEDVSRNREDKNELSRIMTAVTVCKCILGIGAFVLILVLCGCIEKFQEDVPLYLLFFIWIFTNALLPDYLYRGIEQMSMITYRTVAIKLFFTVMIFVFLKDASQYYVVPLLNFLGVLGACIWLYIDLYKKHGVRFMKVPLKYIWATMKRSSSFFFSRIASTVYGATNTFILGFVDKVGIVTGYYTSAEKLTSTARSAFSPIADSLYPYMIKNRNFKLIKKILLVLMPPICLGCFVLGIFAEEFCVFFFGPEYAGAGKALVLLLPVVVFTLPGYILGFPTLSPLGLAKHANLSTVFGAVIQIIQLAALWTVDGLCMESICIATCITEAFVLLYRIVVVFRHRNEL